MSAREEASMDSPMQALPQGSGEHPINYVEFVARDLARVETFFQAAFGWETSRWSEGYGIFGDSAGMRGGINATRPEQPLRPFTYVRVQDVDAALARTTAAGGTTVVEKMVIDEASGGGIAFFTDPAGVITGLSDIEMPKLPSPNPFGAEKPRDNSICSLELYGGDFALTRDFYGGLFGWACTETMPDFMAFAPGRGLSGVFQSHTPQTHAVAYVWADDIAATLGRIEAAGGRREGEPTSMPGLATFAYFWDTEGCLHGLIAR
jgi:uncharacterized protein